MTITQAKGLRLGQRVTGIISKRTGVVVGVFQSHVIIEWDYYGKQPIAFTGMHSIHIMAN